MYDQPNCHRLSCNKWAMICSEWADFLNNDNSPDTQHHFHNATFSTRSDTLPLWDCLTSSKYSWQHNDNLCSQSFAVILMMVHFYSFRKIFIVCNCFCSIFYYCQSVVCSPATNKTISIACADWVLILCLRKTILPFWKDCILSHFHWHCDMKSIENISMKQTNSIL